MESISSSLQLLFEGTTDIAGTALISTLVGDSRESKDNRNHAVAQIRDAALAHLYAANKHTEEHRLGAAISHWYTARIQGKDTQNLGKIDQLLYDLFRQGHGLRETQKTVTAHAAGVGQAQSVTSLFLSKEGNLEQLEWNEDAGVALFPEDGVVVRHAINKDGPVEEVQFQQLLALLQGGAPGLLMSWPLQSSATQRGIECLGGSQLPMSCQYDAEEDVYETVIAQERSRAEGQPVQTGKPYVHGMILLNSTDATPLSRFLCERLSASSRRTALLLLDLQPKDLHSGNVGFVPSDRATLESYLKAEFRVSAGRELLPIDKSVSFSDAMADLLSKDSPADELIEVTQPGQTAVIKPFKEHTELYNLIHGAWELVLFDQEMCMHTSNHFMYGPDGQQCAAIRYCLLHLGMGESPLTEQDLLQLCQLGTPFVESVRWMTHADAGVYRRLPLQARREVMQQVLKLTKDLMPGDSIADGYWQTERQLWVSQHREEGQLSELFKLLERHGIRCSTDEKDGLLVEEARHRVLNQLFPRFSPRAVQAYIQRVSRRTQYAAFHLEMLKLNAFGEQRTAQQTVKIMSLILSEDRSILTDSQKQQLLEDIDAEPVAESSRTMDTLLASLRPTPLGLARYMYPTFSLSEKMLEFEYESHLVGDYRYCLEGIFNEYLDDPASLSDEERKLNFDYSLAVDVAKQGEGYLSDRSNWIEPIVDVAFPN